MFTKMKPWSFHITWSSYTYGLPEQPNLLVSRSITMYAARLRYTNTRREFVPWYMRGNCGGNLKQAQVKKIIIELFFSSASQLKKSFDLCYRWFKQLLTLAPGRTTATLIPHWLPHWGSQDCCVDQEEQGIFWHESDFFSLNITDLYYT